MNAKSRAVIIVCLIVAGLLAGGAYWHYHGGNTASHEAAYYCPMHPTYTSDKPGKCPICGMELIPIKNDDSVATKSGEEVDPLKERIGFTLSTDRQQLIGVKLSRVEKKDAVKEIRAAAQVAFDPQLAITQQEYLEAKRLGDEKIVKAARERLILLGMNDATIATLTSVQTNLYQSGKTSWIYPLVYEFELPYVKIGQSVDLTLLDGSTYNGIVRSVDPVLDPKTRTARVHVEMDNKGAVVRPESFATGIIKVNLGEKLTVPKSAVIITGRRNIVFVVHDGAHFMPKEVVLGPELQDEYVIESGLNEGDEVVTSATFLIDSESKIKASQGSGETSMEHKH